MRTTSHCRKFSGVEQSSRRPPTTASVHHCQNYQPLVAGLHPGQSDTLPLSPLPSPPGQGDGDRRQNYQEKYFKPGNHQAVPLQLISSYCYSSKLGPLSAFSLHLSLPDDRLRDYFGFLFTINLFSIMVDHLISHLTSSYIKLF